LSKKRPKIILESSYLTAWHGIYSLVKKNWLLRLGESGVKRTCKAFRRSPQLYFGRRFFFE